MKRWSWIALLAAAPLWLAVPWVLVLSLWFSGGLKRVAAWYALQLLLPPAGLAVWVWCALVAWRDPARRPFAGGMALWAGVSLVPLAMLLGLWTPRYPVTIEQMQPAVTVRLPLDGPVVVGWGGDTVATNYHAATPDQRWAYDLLVEPGAHGSADLNSYGCYGLDVLAPIAGTVAIVHDGEPDQDPSVFVPNFEQPAGNHVALELETGTYLLLAHLIPGSIVVAEGDAVAEGQVLGKCGNSGNTSEPHVHVHHVRQKPEMIGFGEGLPLYFRDHDGDPMPKGGIEMDGEKVRMVGDRVRHLGR